MLVRYKNLFFLVFIALIGALSIPVNGQAPDKVELFVTDFTQNELRLRIETNASEVLTEINRAFNTDRAPSLSRSGTTDEVRASLNALWSNSFYIPDTRVIESIARLVNGRYEVRNIPILIKDPDGKEHYEEAVMQFTPSGLLDDFRIGLPAHRFQQLIREGQDDVDLANRREILQFVENFRTAYNRKDLNYIDNVFSAQALIIVGRVVQNTGQESAFQQQVEYLQFTKEEYVERLGRVFKANAWIDVKFEDIRILRHQVHPEVYGVSLTQYYTSSIYSDEGFLFLLIDFKDAENPMIHVRTWQPRSATPEEQVFTLGDMEIF